uniref:Uncharacterized protein n=1 Tax=Seriola dumerili TaxID=41447 RepID=A0A3B4TLX9_SERDU
SEELVVSEVLTLVSLTDRYEGETCDGQSHGEGVACFEGGHMYKVQKQITLHFEKVGKAYKFDFIIQYAYFFGEFVCNIPMGQGAYTWPNGSTYTGEVYNGIRHGTGIYKCAINGVLYRGQWDQGKRHGKGVVYYNQDKTSWYKGDWVKNNREGLGERCNRYTGDFVQGQRHGLGTFYYAGGAIYEGEWKNNKKDGKVN